MSDKTMHRMHVCAEAKMQGDFAMSEVNDILYEALIQGREGQSLIPEAAKLGGIGQRTLYDYCSNPSRTVSVHAIRGAFAATQHPALKTLLEPPGWRLVQVQHLPVPGSNDLRTELEDVVIQASEIMGILRRGICSGDSAATMRAARAIGQLETEVAELRRLFEDTITGRK